MKFLTFILVGIIAVFVFLLYREMNGGISIPGIRKPILVKRTIAQKTTTTTTQG